MSPQPWDLPSSGTPVPVGWGDHESAELDRLARRLRDERTKQVTLAVPKEKRGVVVPKARRVAQPRPTASGRWCIRVQHDGGTSKRTFDTAEQAIAWRDRMTKEQQYG